jgi:FkbM family methyltransferase
MVPGVGMNRLRRWIRIALEDPALVPRIVARKTLCGRGLGDEPVRRRIGDVWFEFDPELGEMARAMYCGLYEIRVIDAMKRLLPRGGTFLDVGANVGYHSAVAADLVGPRGVVYSIEPVGIYFDRLVRLARMNPDYTIIPERAAAGDGPGTATISIAGRSNAGWNTLVPGHMPDERRTATERVPVTTLDAFLDREGVTSVSLIKIDVEGFELPVLRGLRRFLSATDERPPILCEIAPRAYPLLKTSLDALESRMERWGYRAYDVRRRRRPVDLTQLQKFRDVLFLQETEVGSRLPGTPNLEGRRGGP